MYLRIGYCFKNVRCEPIRGISVAGLYQFIFASAATRALGVDDLLMMLEKSRADNKKHEVTGALLYLSDMFLQVLEGPKDDILQLYDLIQKDDRNKNIDPINGLR